MAKVRLEGVTKRYGRVVAVDNVSFEVGDKEFFAILGPTGCGKTTTLRIIAGLEFPDEGRIYIDDRDVTYVHPKDRDVAMVFQVFALYPHMTVFDNIAFPLRVRKKELGLTEDDIRNAVISVAKMLHIEDLLDRKPSQLSGGQQQRVALARALVRKPKVWLLDEPLSNIDAKLRVFMRAEIKNLQRSMGVTTIYVTHDQVEAMSMADRVAVMNAGRVVQIGPPLELYNRPRNTFVATFIGSPPMNIVECEHDAEKALMVCHSVGGLTVKLDPEVSRVIEEKAKRREVLLGFRPEHVILSPTPIEGYVKGRVASVERLGSENIVYVEVGAGEVVRAKTSRDFELGSTVYVSVDPSRVLVFDKVTQELIV